MPARAYRSDTFNEQQQNDERREKPSRDDGESLEERGRNRR
jgi:hypothetical protein